MAEQSFGVLTWRKGVSKDIDVEPFTKIFPTDENSQEWSNKDRLLEF